MSIKLNVDEIIKMETIKYKRLTNTDREGGEDLACVQSLLNDDEKNLNLLDEEDLTLLHGEDFSWFRRSVHFLLFFIVVAGVLLLMLMVLPKKYTTGASFENGFGVRIPLDFRRLEAQKEIQDEAKLQNNDSYEKWKLATNGRHQTPTAVPVLPKRPDTQQNLQTQSNSFTLPVYIPPKEAKDLQCPKFFEPNANFNGYRKHRLTYRDPKNETDLPMSCEAIKKRSYFQTQDLYPDEREFPIAFARAVFADYRFLEMELAATYAPQNFYCYALDSKASPLFHKRMNALADCFPNVYLTQHEFHMDSAGHNMGYSHHECMKLLAKEDLNWKYLVLLQNHDVALKTNQELVHIYKLFNGTNDISAGSPPWERINRHANWTFEALHLFKNETRNLLPHKGFKPVIRFLKSLVQVSVSRAMIEFMLNELDMTRIMKQIEWRAYGIDEILMATINAADAIDAPGGYTDYCIDHYRKAESAVTRMTYWAGNPCRSGLWRHNICLFAMEHLHELSDTTYLFANKFMPDRDFGSIACWHEHLFNQTHFDRGTKRLKSDFYLSLPHVRFNRERNQKGDAFDVKTFNCSF
ncbi:N-acetyllactosaminide beta-1,6-N-acetylglucosaminyl-transferase, isoform C [Aphelenchoides bicaudatus]|nr:N-acetyllactosaminide beta-1,6-N-acetylglucosaminyl-transferase, isoform C [Aphelenchoides bicaudatus]